MIGYHRILVKVVPNVTQSLTAGVSTSMEISVDFTGDELQITSESVLDYHIVLITGMVNVLFRLLYDIFLHNYA